MTDEIRDLMRTARGLGLNCWVHDDRDSIVVVRDYTTIRREHRVYTMVQLHNLLG